MKRNNDTNYTIVDNRWIGTNTMLMVLEGPTDEFTMPGQFINIAIPGFTLRRPISVCDIEGDLLTIVYDVVGHGTEALSIMKPGTRLDILPALGRGFDISKCGDRPVLLGGGVGCPPIYSLAKNMISREILPTVILGFNSDERMIMIEQFENLDIPFYVATVDGSYGTKGFVTDVIKEEGLNPDYFYACGPLPMLRALCLGLTIPGQVSLEARMACGFGACMCCSLETKSGPKRICKEGPVFDKEELIWK
ncbi:MAG: dihydroorotate dehydrogenase electron transfer subunit [Muribaculaceae bacterium]|nr:dihydroorotate dehydrogenase electron transfer subunit [Muribaculaceae bacterium]